MINSFGTKHNEQSFQGKFGQMRHVLSMLQGLHLVDASFHHVLWKHWGWASTDLAIWPVLFGGGRCFFQ